MAPQLIDKNGVTVYIYGKEHVPPHVHAFCAEDEALVNIRTGEIFEGHISNKKLRVIQEWLDEGENRKIVEQNFYELNPRLKLQKTEAKKEVKKTTIKTKTKNRGGK